MKIVEHIRGAACVEICGAFPESLLNAAALSALELWDMESVDAYTVRVKTFESGLPELEALAERCMCDLRVLTVYGGSRERRMLLHRRVLAVFLILTALLLFFSSLFIWDIRIYGNETLTDGEILRALEECGVGRGSYWPDINSDELRCEMLLKLPELSWMTVNVHGSCADVPVTERTKKPEIYTENRYADMIAAKTGIIQSMTVLNGSALVSEKQAVTEGEILISGKMDSITNEPRYVCAEGSVKAKTWYEISAVCPEKTQIKSGDRLKALRFAVKAGKKQINFYNSSRKTIDECDKIIHEYKLGIEGLFALPVSLIAEEYRQAERTEEQSLDINGMKTRLEAALRETIDGDIESIRFTCSRSGGVLYVTAHASCLEEIGRVSLR